MEANREYWRAVSIFTKYEVSSVGRVRNSETGRVLKPAPDGSRYLHVVLHKEGEKRTKKIHQLVAEAFVENPEDKRCVDHVDSNRTNKCAGNLRWATHSENGMNRMNRANASSIYKGVCFDKASQKWKSYIRISGKLKHLGYHLDETEAAEAYNASATEHFKDYKKLNEFTD